MSEPLRLALIGCGRISQVGYAPAIASASGVELVAVADPDAERRTTLAAAASARAYETAEALVADCEPQAVIVASPPALHLEHAALAARAGLPCLVEKPPAPDASGAVELAALDPAPWIGFNRRFLQGPALLVAATAAETPIEIEIGFAYRRASWRAHAVRDDALLDLGAHLIDLAMLLGGEARLVERAVTGPERAELELELERGRAILRAATDRPHRERAVVRERGDADGRRGAVLGRTDTGGLLRASAARLRRGPHPLAASLRAQVEAFARAARGEPAGLLAGAEQGALVMGVLEAARRAAGEERPAAVFASGAAVAESAG